MEAVLENAYILIYEKKISSLKDLLPDARKGRQGRQARSSSSPKKSKAKRSRPSS